MKEKVIVIGAGLAGSEAAWQIAERGIDVELYEMRPAKKTGAHKTDLFAELVCSNSLGTKRLDRASGLLKEELKRLGSMVLECAEATEIPAGGALAVGRDEFSRCVTAKINGNRRIKIIREEAVRLPDDRPLIIATGPLTSMAFSVELKKLLGNQFLYFFDAIAPIVTLDSIDMNIAFRESRYGRNKTEEGDYINCPFDRKEYYEFVNALISAKRFQLHEFELNVNSGVAVNSSYFEACMPIEVLAARGEDTLAYGPMRPVGLKDPRTGKRPYAVVQLRQDNIANTLYNLVGFQTNLTISEQERVFRMIPGLENAEFVRYGQMHRNLYINSPFLLRENLELKKYTGIYFAGQITGSEGYVSSIATGLLAGINAANSIIGEEPFSLPRETMFGSLIYYITNASIKEFQPMKANFGILPEMRTKKRIGKAQKRQLYVERALNALDNCIKGKL